jgi:hypothetical protein
MLIGLLIVAGTLLISLLILPSVTALSIAGAAYSPHDIFLLGTLQLTVEAAPIGTCSIVQMPSTASLGLMHSNSYENEAALTEVMKWVLRGYKHERLDADEEKAWHDAINVESTRTRAVEDVLARTKRRRLTWRYITLCSIATAVVAGIYLWSISH